jgi:hypothetical protein
MEMAALDDTVLLLNDSDSYAETDGMSDDLIYLLLDEFALGTGNEVGELLELDLSVEELEYLEENFSTGDLL